MSNKKILTKHFLFTFSSKSAMTMSEMWLDNLCTKRHLKQTKQIKLKQNYTYQTKTEWTLDIKILMCWLTFCDDSSNRITLEVKLNVHVFALKYKFTDILHLFANSEVQICIRTNNWCRKLVKKNIFNWIFFPWYQCWLL